MSLFWATIEIAPVGIMNKNFLDDIVRAQKRGEPRGITAICSAHPWVLRTAMLQRRETLLIESTCNQVNQFGGYSGMTPADFVAYVRRLAGETGFPWERVMLGGDHLGPHVWQAEGAERAMAKAVEMVRAYVRAGYTKIHLDASMRLADDPPGPPAPEVIADRAAQMARAAEELAREPGRAGALRYVIGTEVPVPGGAQAAAGVEVTSVERGHESIEIHRQAFCRVGVAEAWERLIAVVVQPGVEFGDDFVLAYQSAKAQPLAAFIERAPGLVYEAHSTDYQTPAALRALVRDHFAILKVGPGLTFAYREALVALAMMEAELFPPRERSGLLETLEAAMLRHPEHWQKYYHGTPEEQAFKRRYSFSDRVRYYWAFPEVQAAVERLMRNLERKKPWPLTLISQFAPQAYEKIRAGALENSPQAVIRARVERVLEEYALAEGGGDAMWNAASPG